MKFTTNIGSTDAILRIVIGIILLGLWAMGTIGLW
ncbi:MAG: YgaP-like transmembrane domain, partial [Pseudomonadota bacterium]